MSRYLSDWLFRVFSGWILHQEPLALKEAVLVVVVVIVVVIGVLWGGILYAMS